MNRYSVTFAKTDGKTSITREISAESLEYMIDVRLKFPGFTYVDVMLQIVEHGVYSAVHGNNAVTIADVEVL